MLSAFALLAFFFAVDPPAIFRPTGIYAQREESTVNRFYVVMFTAKWCGPCQQYKRDGHLDRLKSRADVVVTDIDEEPQLRQTGIKTVSPDGESVDRAHVERVPTFWIVRKSDRWPLHQFHPGAVQPDEIMKTMKDLASREQ